jgi:hypothetical protein
VLLGLVEETLQGGPLLVKMPWKVQVVMPMMRKMRRPVEMPQISTGGPQVIVHPLGSPSSLSSWILSVCEAPAITTVTSVWHAPSILTTRTGGGIFGTWDSGSVWHAACRKLGVSRNHVEL